MKVIIDSDACQGHGRCYAIAPDVFTDDDDGYPVVLEPEVPPALEERARAAVHACPERAISLTE